MATEQTIEERWASWKESFNKSYSDEEEKKRFKFFKSNVQSIEEHNKKYEAGETTYTQAVNKFADLGPGESPCGCSRNRGGDKDAKICV